MPKYAAAQLQGIYCAIIIFFQKLHARQRPSEWK